MLERLREAVLALDAIPATQVLRASGVYRNPPMGPGSQPDYLNAVAAIATGLDAHALLDHLQAIEQAHGRVRDSGRWQARTLDLDLLLFSDQRIQGARLVVPHPGLPHRAFVIHPLAEIAPDALVPGYGRAAQLALRVPASGLLRVAPALRA